MLQSKITRAQPARPAQETATLVMCPPDYFDVTYQINPWMDLSTWNSQRETWRAKAWEEWRALKALYETLGHTVHTIAPQPGLPDMVFMANCAAVLDGKALLAKFRHQERRGEEPFYSAYFGGLERDGVIDEVVHLPDGFIFEGCGDAQWDAQRGLFWVGYSQRTSVDAPHYVGKTFGVDVVPLEMVSPRYYHLDVALAALSGGEVVYLPDAFSEVGRAEIKRIVSPDKLIAATPEDAEVFAVNLVNLGQDIILSGASDHLKTALEAAGYRLHFVDTQAFQLAGGSIFCLTQRLDRRVNDRPT